MQLAQADGLDRVALLLIQHGMRVHELTADTFDLRAYYRERVVAERLRRTEADVPAYPGGRGVDA